MPSDYIKTMSRAANTSVYSAKDIPRKVDAIHDSTLSLHIPTLNFSTTPFKTVCIHQTIFTPRTLDTELIVLASFCQLSVISIRSINHAGYPSDFLEYTICSIAL